MSDTEDDDPANYDSGPFCIHWNDPVDCDEVCAACAHTCAEHSGGGEFNPCTHDGCTCKQFTEKAKP